MQMFYDYLAATAGIVTGVFGTLFLLCIATCVITIALAAIVGAFGRGKRKDNVVRPRFGNNK